MGTDTTSTTLIRQCTLGPKFEPLKINPFKNSIDLQLIESKKSSNKSREADHNVSFTTRQP